MNDEFKNKFLGQWPSPDTDKDRGIEFDEKAAFARPFDATYAVRILSTKCR